MFEHDLKRTTRVAITGSSAAIDDYLRRRPLPQAPKRTAELILIGAGAELEAAAR